MSISTKELKALLQKSGNRCAFPSCSEVLLHKEADNEDPVILSKIAHIVADSTDGPRGRYPLPLEERDKESNLLLLCSKHHDIIDKKPQLYTVERLRQIKEDHEAHVLEVTGEGITKQAREKIPLTKYVRESLYSTLFSVVELPVYVYGAPCKYSETQNDEIKRKIVPLKDGSVIYPYIIRSGNLYAFQDLGYRKGPFQNIVISQRSQRYKSSAWWDDPIRQLWFIDLLNRSLNKLTGRKGLQWDRDHHRYYFQSENPVQVKEISYRPLNQTLSKKQVVWQPISKLTGQPRPYWLHRAVNLKFHRIAQSQWCFTIRPEFRVTKDGITPEESEKVGSRVTRKKSRMFNYDLLGEVNFWRDFLSDSSPRIILNFGRGQYVIISTAMMQTEVDWPGIPEQFAKPFKNIEYPEDLFSWAKLAGLDFNLEHEPEDEDEGEEWREEVEELEDGKKP